MRIRQLRTARAVISEAVQSRRTTLDALVRELDAAANAGCLLPRQVLAEVRVGARSAPEAELLVGVVRTRLPLPHCNEDVLVGERWIACPDAWWDVGLAVEVDSAEWHSSPELQAATRRRHRRLGRIGFVVLHYTPAEIRADMEGVLAEIIETHDRLVGTAVAASLAGVGVVAGA